jgi:hypothetical protein
VTPPEDEKIAPPARGASRLPDLAPEPEPDLDEAAPDRSLRDDVEALIDDGKTYLEAELNYQKTRAAFVADRARAAVMLFAAAALLGFLALIGVTVGLIIALSPLLTPWGASALVVGLLVVATLLAARAAAARWNRLMAAIQEKPEP